MEKVQMVISGKLALVDADQVKKLQKKQMLVANALNLQNKMKASTDITVKALLMRELDETMSKIIRLNRTIRQNVRFI